MTVESSQLQELAVGIDGTLAELEARIFAEIMAETFPLVGDGLADAAAAGEQALQALNRLRTEMVTALVDLQAIASNPLSAVENAINTGLANAGFSNTTVTVTEDGDEVRIALQTGLSGSFSQSLGAGLGLGFLGLETGGSATVDVSYAVDMDFATDSGGFFIDTTGDADITIEVDISNPLFDQGLHINGQEFGAVDAGTSLDSVIEIDLSATSERIGLLQVGSATVDGTYTGTLGAQIDITALDQGAFTPPISASFGVDWTFTDETIAVGDNNSAFGAAPSIGFDEVTLDLGEFMESFIGPLIDQINALLEPLRPVINVLTASIKLLENFPGLGGVFDVNKDDKVNLLDIAEMLSDVLGLDLDLTAFTAIVNLAEDVIVWADFLDSAGFSTGQLNLGDVDLAGVDFRAPDFDWDDVKTTLGGAADVLDTVLDGLSGGGWDATVGDTGQTGKRLLQSIVDNSIFGLPILTDPDQWTNLLLGRSADLVDIDLPEVNVSLGGKNGVDLLRVPIFPLVFLKVIAKAGFSIDMDFGFDTRGLLDPNLDAIDGFYFKDNAGAEIRLFSGVGLGLELNLGVLSAGGSGDVQGEILLDLNEGSAMAGRLYYDEFIDLINDNVFSIFDASGSITAGFSAYVDSIFGEIWRWDSPRILLGSFGFDTFEGVINGEVSNGVLTTFTGGRSDQRTGLSSLFDDISEVIQIYQAPGGGITLSIGADFLPPTGDPLFEVQSQTFEQTITKIRGNGKNDADVLSVDDNVDINVEFYGGDGADTLSGGSGNDTFFGGNENDVLLGNLGNDNLNGAADDDELVGGEGADTLNGGAGSDLANYLLSDAAVHIDFAAASQSGGHAEGDVLNGIENIIGSIYDDTIEGATGAGTFAGFEGDDSLRAGGHPQYLFGNGGNDTLNAGLDAVGGTVLAGGEGDDLYIVRVDNIITSENFLDNELAEGSDSGYDELRGYVDIDLRGMDNHIEFIQLYGSATTAFANDIDNLLIGNAEDNALFGYGGDDTIWGYAGDDSLYGWQGDDNMSAGDGDDFLLGDEGNDTLRGKAGNDELNGGDGDDSIFGGDGIDTLRGNDGADTMTGGADADFYLVDSLDEVYEDDLGGVDYLWLDDTHTLLKFQEIEIMSLYDWEDQIGSITLLKLADIAPGNTAQDSFDRYTLYAFALGLNGQLGATPNADLTGNEYAQLIIAEIGNIETARFDNVIEGLSGADTILGDDLGDLAQYSTSNEAIEIDLSLPEQTGGHAEGDMLVLINNIRGSSHDDTILGQNGDLPDIDDKQNYLEGGDGDDFLNGFGLDDELHGGNGKDTLIGGRDDDSLMGDAGVDSLDGGDGDDTLDGGTGIDILNGGLGHDFYRVTTLDVIIDSGGDDTLEASTNYTLRAGIDIETLRLIEGTAGLTLYGNSDGQVLVGNDGDNLLHGGGGADVIIGQGGDDTASYILSDAAVQIDLRLNAAAGGHAAGDSLIGIENLIGSVFGDTLIGLASSIGDGTEDNLHQGFGGADFISDTHGENTLRGGAGDDTLVGSGVDGAVNGYGSWLIGGSGNDSLDAGAATATGGDTLGGGTGDDIYRVTSAGDVVDETWDGQNAGGHDTLISDVAVWSMDVPEQADIEDAELGLGVELDANDLSNHVTGNALDNILRGKDGDDTLLGLGGADTLRGGEGNDRIEGGLGEDVMYGWNGDDLFFANATGDSVIEEAGRGHDTIRASADYTLAANVEVLELIGSAAINGTGTDASETLRGNEAANILTGLDGDDTLNGRGGHDTIYGRTGDDLIMLAGTDGIDAVHGGFGEDTLDATGYTDGPLTVRMGAFTWTAGGVSMVMTSIETLLATSQADDIAGNGFANMLEGRDGDDTLSGNGGNDLLRGGLGADVLNGNTGADTLIGGDGNDTADGGEGNDLVEGKLGDDSLLGGDGDDTLLGEEGADTLDGGTGHDSLDGGAHADTLLGQGGDDTLIGGGGNDSIEGGYGADSIDGNGGNDTANGGNGNDVLNGLGGRDLLRGGDGEDSIFGGTAEDFLVGGKGNDLVMGDGGRDTVQGNAGNDSLIGGDGADRLLGGIDDDTLEGGDGADSLIGGTGKDTLSGGADADLFIFYSALESRSNARDVIDDFASGEDQIVLTGIDADVTLVGDQAFTFIGNGAFAAAGDLRFLTDGTDGVLQGDINGDGSADFALELTGATALTLSDLAL